jgi:hypothetical protein
MLHIIQAFRSTNRTIVMLDHVCMPGHGKNCAQKQRTYALFLFFLRTYALFHYLHWFCFPVKLVPLQLQGTLNHLGPDSTSRDSWQANHNSCISPYDGVYAFSIWVSTRVLPAKKAGYPPDHSDTAPFMKLIQLEKLQFLFHLSQGIPNFRMYLWESNSMLFSLTHLDGKGHCEIL